MNYNVKKQEIYYSIEFALVSVISFIAGHYTVVLCHQKFSVIGGFWCMVCSVVTLSPTFDQSKELAKKRIIGCMIGVFIAFFSCIILGYGYLSLFLSIGISIFITRLLKFYKGTRIASTQAADVVGLGIIFHGFNLYINVSTRILEAFSGVLISLICVYFRLEIYNLIRLKGKF
jgi:uncharacterized membrane protein YgaE (UPF0421/DUF939 family)